MTELVTRTVGHAPVSLSMKILRAFVKMLPGRMQDAASKWYFFRQIQTGNFKSIEAEWDRLSTWLKPGDWCIDVGANVGRYSLKMSELVGPSGQVIAFEPLTHTFNLLTHFVEKGNYGNITLLNAAATEQPSLIRMASDVTPLNASFIFDTKTRSRISNADGDAGESKLGLSIDALKLPHRVAFIKVDVEGHELSVCKGMAELIARDHPVLVIEDHDNKSGVAEFLAPFGYRGRRASDNARNLVFTKDE
ncbi:MULTISPECIES: FkbM family methyltransferase [unclassified Herbaspirillum]|uniref:FkbM family methyltransferase n=1 Tax=unclassified Herbaspirillum TaxID=2624150 RepID=UPI000E2EB12D|nr:MULTISPECIES: FkbM family methyltransferase [unclassified Herbaspirillum]RFB71079.1 FkbM family methyltransferase [Herbaspirillum sp. 3R-3a1]TFI08397.1 FkbM family methyltransferase [Herbaspirillum sp. 3R11]TFI14812.1 FkbM family methyltransferase [Herbaspirillum sp. 3R-11]TFI29400.1 FkbM family methyltransferase [Herbaspirillum sp. 3C11]